MLAKELIEARAIGDPVIYCGGLGGWDLAEFGSHWIDLMRYIHGDQPVRVLQTGEHCRDGPARR